MEAYVAEYGFSSSKKKIIRRAAVGHVGKPVAGGTSRKIGAASVYYTNHFQTAGGRIGQYHGDFLIGNKWEILLQQNIAHSIGAAYCNCMETVGNPVVAGDAAKTGISGVNGAVNGNADSKCIGGSI